MTNHYQEKKIGDIANCYGGLSVRSDGDRFYWSIENWNGDSWDEIPKYLYDSLVKYEMERIK